MLRPIARHVPLFVLLIAVGILATSCGHKGELYLPGKKEKEQKTSLLPSQPSPTRIA
ncbi:hypothetical protein SIID45300_02785 [Candidatus Magnetaquicoccaceae bacterium FCR-1]|uniref:Lipoprotein n=1 Tax=Candidatus Magnetaquiglobus chichijimensis TaxID=3141448 RepID=A0ABQ0CC06_9PROT